MVHLKGPLCAISFRDIYNVYKTYLQNYLKYMHSKIHKKTNFVLQ